MSEHVRSTGLATLCLILALFSSALSSAGFKPGQLNEADRAVPATDLADLDANRWSPADLGGVTTVINFWASWCAPCREEMPSLNRAWQKLQGKDVNMLAVNLGDSVNTINNFMQQVPIEFPVLVSSNPSDLAAWGVRGLPTTLIVNTEGRIIRELVGITEWDADEMIQQILELRGDDKN